MIKLILALLMTVNIQTATLHCTHDDVACFETKDGLLWEVYVDEPDILMVGEYSLLFVGDNIVQFAQR